MKFASEFRKFIARGNVVDLAIGIIIGAAFNKIVTSLVNDIVMPPVGLIVGKVNFNNLFINLTDDHYESLADAKAAGAATINYGAFLTAILDFLIIALVVFFVIRHLNKLRLPEEKKPASPPPAPTIECPYCISKIPAKAVRCPNCTSHIPQVNVNS